MRGTHVSVRVIKSKNPYPQIKDKVERGASTVYSDICTKECFKRLFIVFSCKSEEFCLNFEQDLIC